MAVWFHSDYPGFQLLEKRKLKKWIKLVIKNYGFTLGTINYSFLSDDQLLEINKEFLNHDFYTDVISFDYSDQKIISGDIYISIDRIRDNSNTYDVSFNDELKRVIIHGVLHFLGFKDKSKKEAQIMREKESDCLQILNSTK